MRVFIAILGFFIAFGVTGCFKNEEAKPCTPKTVESEMPAMTKFATDSSITTTQDPSGLLYEIIDPGTGATPALTSNITIKYTGRLMNGTKFDENLTGISFKLNELIEAWQIALPKIKAGGKIKIISPSKLAYGCASWHQLANQPLYFNVELVSVQ